MTAANINHYYPNELKCCYIWIYFIGTAYHNSYHACPRCTTIGEYDKIGRHMSYPRLDAPLRTDADFRTKKDPDHHKVNGMTREYIVSPLERLPINMVQDFVIGDSLHLIDLGIMRRLLNGWKNGGYNFRDHKLSVDQQVQMSANLKKYNARRPSELHRAIRGIDCLAFWKGLEYRTFLLYLGPTILKDVSAKNVYDHFMILFCAITICSCQSYIDDGYLDLAEELLKIYLEHYIQIYQIDSINNNLHNLRHLIEDVRKFGALPKFSAYPFENKLGQIKHLLRTGNQPLAQVVNRLSEISNILANKSKEYIYPYLHKEIKDDDTISLCNKRYEKLYLMDGIMFANNVKDQWILTKSSEIVKMIFATCTENKIRIYGASLKDPQNFFLLPIESRRLNIFCCTDITNSPKLYELSDIKCKMISLIYKNKLVFIPIIHTLDLLRENN